MKFLDLTIKNFLTVGEGKVNLDNRGLILIQGANEDDPSASSNGAGKSSVVDALCWVLFGTTARGVSGDAVVNKTNKKDCKVSIVMTEGDDRYVITRYRKDSAQKNALFVVLCDSMMNSTDISKGTDRETQLVVDKIIGCSLDVFMAAVYCGQEMMPDLPGMTDKTLKTLIEEAAGVQELTAAYASARASHVNVKTLLALSSGAYDRDAKDLATAEEEYVEIGKSAEFFEEARREKAKAELINVPALNAKIRIATREMAMYESLANPVESTALQAQLDSYESERAIVTGLFEASGKYGRLTHGAKVKAESAGRELKAAQKALEDVALQVGTGCKSCGKEYHADDLCDVRGIREDAVMTAAKNARAVLVELKDITAKGDAAEVLAKKASDALPDVSAVAARMNELTAAAKAAAVQARDIATLESQIEIHKAAGKAKLTEANPWTKAQEGKKKDIEHRAAELATKKTQMDKAEGEEQLLANAVKVFGPAGVRAHILDTVTPFLNERTSEYLGAMSDGNIHAVWTTLTKSAKGELKEKFSIDVSNDLGSETFMGLSGGEKRKVRLACSMALQDMVASRATKPLSLWIGDEIDNALDESGLERLMGLLEVKAKERGTVLIVSHASLSDWVDSVITVTKKGGLSTLTGAV